MTYPTLNHISLFGRVASVPAVTPIGRVRALTLGVETDDDGGARVHRVIIQDEFLAKAMHDRLVEGATVQVLGELDYDDVGAFVSVTQRRGSDVHVLGGEATAVPQARPVSPPRPVAQATPAAQTRTESPAAGPEPIAQATVPAPTRPSPPAASAVAQSASPAPVAAAPRPAPTAAMPAPIRRPPLPPTPSAMPSPPRAAPPRPPGGALSGLQSGAKSTQVEDPFPGDTPSASHASSPRPNGVGRPPTGPDSLDDDIPF